MLAILFWYFSLAGYFAAFKAKKPLDELKVFMSRWDTLSFVMTSEQSEKSIIIIFFNLQNSVLFCILFHVLSALKPKALFSLEMCFGLTNPELTKPTHLINLCFFCPACFPLSVSAASFSQSSSRRFLWVVWSSRSWTVWLTLSTVISSRIMVGPCSHTHTHTEHCSPLHAPWLTVGIGNLTHQLARLGSPTEAHTKGHWWGGVEIPAVISET